MNLKALLGAIAMTVIILAASTQDSNASVIDEVKLEGVILQKVTPQWLAEAKIKYAKQFAILKDLNNANNFPEGTLQSLWVVESMCGELNIKNKAGYEGQAQFGAYEQNKFGVKDPYNFTQAMNGVVRLLRDYHVNSQSYLHQPVMWEQRSRVDWYFLHQQGFRGSSQQYNAAAGAAELPGDLLANIRGNLPQRVKAQLFTNGKLKPNVSKRELVIVFYRVWDKEISRIWTAIK